MSGRALLPLCGAVLLLLGGCTITEKRLSAKEYYTQANDAFVREDFPTAVEYYRNLMDQYPLNPYSEEAQLKVAYSYYLDKKYTEAIASFSDFERAYPTSSHLPFVEYYRGMCYLEQMRSTDRDQSVTEKAHDFFRTIVDRYPESSFAQLAEEKIRICRDAMATHELYIADFNDNIARNLFAALVRLRRVIENYPETEATMIALSRLEAILKEGQKPELAELAAKALAVRQAAKASTNHNSPHDSSELPPPSVDPLLSLVVEIKKAEEEIRRDLYKAPEVKEVKSEEKALNQLVVGGEEEE